MTDSSSSTALWLGLAAALVFLYRAAMATLLAAYHTLPSIHRRRLLEEEAIPHPMLAGLLADPRVLGMALSLWSQLLLVVLLGLLLPMRYAIAGGAWVLAALTLAYLWVMDLAIPAVLTAGRPEVWLTRLFPLYAPFHRILVPVVDPVARFIERQAEARSRDEEPEEVSEDAVTALLEEGEAEGILQEEDRELIRNVMTFSDTVVREVMTPRTRIKALPLHTTLDEAWDAFRDSRHSRLPVFDGSIDHVAGILLLKDLMQLPDGADATLQSLLKAPHFVPESKPIVDLLRELQRHRSKLAVVVDEYGGVSGLITLEDLLEEVFGEIEDEHETADDIVAQGPGVYLVSGQSHVDDVAQLVGAEWERDGFDTVAGLVMAHLGRIPHPGDALQLDGVRLTVTRMEGTRILQVKVEVHEVEGA